MAYEGHIGFRMFGLRDPTVGTKVLLVVGPKVELIREEDIISSILRGALGVATDDPDTYTPWYELPFPETIFN